MNLESTIQRTDVELTHGPHHPSRNSKSDGIYTVGYRNMDYNTSGSKNVSQ